MPEYRDIQRTAARSLIDQLATSPNDFIKHISNFSGFISLKITYGYTLQGKDDPYLRLVLDAQEGVEDSSNHGFFLVDYFPALKYVPAWFPGASFKRNAKEWNESNQKMRNEPFNWVQRAT
ncbi:hypothetical protein PQX77_014396, partial [Marasmius sp. AFHP31]